MKIIESPHQFQKTSIDLFRQGISTGLVPTMGALHEGHLSLVRNSLSENEKTMVTIFVNPTQFGQNEDLTRYPNTIEQDISSLTKLNVDFLFLPNKADIYPPGYSSYVEVENLTHKLCGLSRPTHFRGVTTICTKLFLLSLPSRSYFGQKDYQQALVIKKLVEDLCIPTTIKILPIVRDEDGLALSSRNVYLTVSQRKEALRLNQSLKLAEDKIKKGCRDCNEIRTTIENHLTESKEIRIDYISLCHPETLEELAEVNQNVLIALAIFIGNTRLIDNILISDAISFGILNNSH